MQHQPGPSNYSLIHRVQSLLDARSRHQPVAEAVGPGIVKFMAQRDRRARPQLRGSCDFGRIRGLGLRRSCLVPSRMLPL